MQEHDRSRLFLFLLGVAAVHALCLAAILPALISLPGHGAGVTQGGIVKEDALVKDAIVDVEVFPSASTLPAPGSHASAYDVAPSHAAIEPETPASAPSPAVSFSPTSDPSDLTSALPDIPQIADTAPGDPVTAEPTAPLAAATPPAADLIGNASSLSSPPVQVEGPGSVSVADPASTNAIPSEEANPATVALPVEKPALKKPSVKPRTTAAKTARPRARRQASVAKPQTQRLFGGFFQSQPRQKAQRVTPRQ